MTVCGTGDKDKYMQFVKVAGEDILWLNSSIVCLLIIINIYLLQTN